MAGFFKQYSWLANIVVILFCSYFTAKIVNVYIGRTLEVHRAIGVLKKAEKPEALLERHERDYYDIIMERNIFDSSEAPPPEMAGTNGQEAIQYVPGAEAVLTTLSVKVYAVLMVGEGKDERSSATVASGKEVDVYSVKGDKTFSPGVTLVQIKPDRIEFLNKGRLEYAKLEDSGEGSIFGPPTEGTQTAEKGDVIQKGAGDTNVKMEDGKFVIDQREIENAITNLDKLYTEIRAVPNFQDGKVSGMKVLSIKPGSVFDKLGIKRGDILSRINGIELDVKRGFDIFNQLKDQKTFTLDLVRGGSTVTFDYEVR